MQMRKHANFRDEAMVMERYPPNRLCARNSDQQMCHCRINHDAIGARDLVDEAGQAAIGGQPKNAAGWILLSRLTLVRKIQIAAGCKYKIVDALETLRTRRLKHWRYAATRGIEDISPVM